MTEDFYCKPGGNGFSLWGCILICLLAALADEHVKSRAKFSRETKFSREANSVSTTAPIMTCVYTVYYYDGEGEDYGF